MSKILIIGAGAMGSAFTFPCIDNKHEVTLIGTPLENDQTLVVDLVERVLGDVGLSGGHDASSCRTPVM